MSISGMFIHEKGMPIHVLMESMSLIALFTLLPRRQYDGGA